MAEVIGNALPIVFWGTRGYIDVVYGYGCYTFAQHEYMRLVIGGERSWIKQ